MQHPSQSGKFSIGRLSWNRRELCRGWLVVGDNTSGKTAAGTNRLLREAFRSDDSARWGGLVIDDTGSLQRTLEVMAEDCGRGGDLVNLSVCPVDAPAQWKPQHRFNLIGDATVPVSALVDALTLPYGKRLNEFNVEMRLLGDSTSFQRGIARHAIEHIIILSREINARITELGPEETRGCFLTRPTLKSLSMLLCSRSAFEETMCSTGVLGRPAQGTMAAAPGKLLDGIREPLTMWGPALVKLDACVRFFKGHYWSLSSETLAGVQNAVREYLCDFERKEIADVFCADSTFNFSSISQGKMIYVDAPQSFASVVRVVNTILKAHFLSHALLRFQRPPEEIAQENMALLFAADAQWYLSRADATPLARIAEVNAGMIAATDSVEAMIGRASLATRSCFPNRLLFRCADEWDTQELNGYVHPRHLKRLRNYECIAVHPAGGDCRVRLSPVGPPDWNHVRRSEEGWLTFIQEKLWAFGRRIRVPHEED